jgi:hypothetical protein
MNSALMAGDIAGVVASLPKSKTPVRVKNFQAGLGDQGKQSEAGMLLGCLV